MGMIIGPTPWWQLSLISTCPVGTTLPDGSRIICKSGGGSAWIVAPSCTQVSATWNGTTTLLVGNKCCISDWATLNTALLNNGFNPADWFVPSSAQLQNPGYLCRSRWDTFASGYGSSTEIDATTMCAVNFGNNVAYSRTKTSACCIRAFRCVTY